MGSGLTRRFPGLAILRRALRGWLSPRYRRLRSGDALAAEASALSGAGEGAEEGRCFNGQEGRKALFRDLAGAFPFRRIVETGTYLGDTTLWMSRASGLPVASCERDPTHFRLACARLSPHPGITLAQSDSRPFLRALAAAPGAGGEETLFYLDAHWGKDCPLEAEVEIIAGGWERFVALVDDFAVPGDEGYGYDIHGTLLRPFPFEIGRLRPVMARHRLGAWFPTLPSARESGSRRGCVVIARGEGPWAEALDRLPSLGRGG